MRNEGIAGDVVLMPYEAGWHGRQVYLAQVWTPGTQDELLPSMIDARVAGVRRTLLISGIEQVTQGRKSVVRCPQTWLCSTERIPDIRWAAMPKEQRTSPTGFHPQDEDAARPL